MFLNVLLSTFGIALRGIDTRFNYVDSNFVSTLSASQTEILPTQFPAVTTLPTPTQKSQKLEEITSVSGKTSIPLPETKTNQTCQSGYTGTFPHCQPEKCRHPTMGVYPNCFVPPCPPRYSGTYPACKRPTDQICPFGSTGSFPNCVVSIQNCPDGSICDDMILIPLLQTSTQAPVTPTEHQLTDGDKKEWEDFKRNFNKTHTNQTNEEHHRQIFLQNQEIVKVHNKRFEQGLETYSLAINQFSDQTWDELFGVDSIKELDNHKVNDIHTSYTVTESVKNEAETVSSER
ncbi:uncharacterized protein LOC119085437 [Bradysia coprophila]|uniref:uncharacterized protein LOC119085437 n=1 Tax=Bradysia coprophila TaxID=38358 RepID=UPI00187DB902|nr:uncharacterized protein LOC119085437 [Bradysia coprophila]